MRTPFSELFHKALVGSLEKEGTSEGAKRGWETRRGRRPAAEEEGGGAPSRPAAEEPEGGRGAGVQERKRARQAEVFAAALRGFHGDLAATRQEHDRNARLRELSQDMGEAGGDFAVDVMGGLVGEVKVGEKNRAIGAWYETDAEGRKVAVSEPSIHSVVEGDEREILRRSAALGRKFDQQAVAVAVHDPAGEGRVFTITLGEGAGDEALEASIDHFLRAGLGGATGMADRPALRLLATSADESRAIEEALRGLPAAYGAVSDSRAARVRFVMADEYDALIGGKEADAGGPVVAEVIVGGVRGRPLAPPQ